MEQFGLEERRRRIRGLLEERSQISVAELAQRFSVSEVTIRGDLKALDGIGARGVSPTAAGPEGWRNRYHRP